MTRTPESVPESDEALVQQFIRIFGHRPSASELERYRRARSRVTLRFPARVRQGAARLILRL